MNNNDVKEYNKFVPEITKETDTLKWKRVLYENICALVPFPKLLAYCKRLIESNSDFIEKINGNSIRTNRYGEELSIDVSLQDGRFKLYTTEWGQTDINRAFIERYDNGCIFARHNNDIKFQGNTGFRRTVSNVLFDQNGKLIYVSKAKITNMDYYMKHEHKVSNISESVEIFVDNYNKCAYSKELKNNDIAYHFIPNVPLLLMDNTNFFETINNLPKWEIDEAIFRKENLSNKVKSLRKCKN